MTRTERLPFALAAWLAFTLACERPSASVAPKAHEPAAASAWHGRAIAAPMGFGGADWLDRADRETTEKPETVLDLLKIREGASVADVGAGTGYFSLRLARRVGGRGHVLATDLEPRMLEVLRQRAAAAGLSNVETVVASEADEHLPEGGLDLVLMVDVYHELARPAAVLAQVRRALRDDGRLALVEYRGEDPTVPIKEEHKMTLAQVKAEVVPEGFRLVEVDEGLPEQRVIVFEKGAAAR